VKKGILNINGSFCGACSYAIEKAGRKLPEVEDVIVNVGLKTITVTYEGDDSILDKIVDIIDKLGHSSEIDGSCRSISND
jgi:copper chaperone CopZ